MDVWFVPVQHLVFLHLPLAWQKADCDYSTLQGQAEKCWAAGRLSVTAVKTAVSVFVNDVSCVERGSGLGVDYFPKQGNSLKGVSYCPGYWFLFQGPLTAVAS